MDAHELEDILAEVGRRILAGEEPWAAVSSTRAASVPALCPDTTRRAIEAGACRIGACGGDPVRLGDLASYVDHTLLKPEATAEQVDQLCAEALEHRFASVCVNGAWVRRCAEVLQGSGVLVCSVIGFPLGAMATEVKAYEACRAIDDGACEIDMVIAVGPLRSGDDRFVQRDIAGVAEVCHRRGTRLKVILETGLLTDEQIVRGSRLAVAGGADFVKTSTGFAKGGATAAHVALMRETVGQRVGVKASGGVRDREAAQAMIDAGATRIGASASVAIVRGGTASGGY